MNSRLSPTRYLTATTRRAQLSPISRPVPIHALNRLSPTTPTKPAPRSPFTTADTSPAALIGRFWTPGLLDTLQAPLSRYRE